MASLEEVTRLWLYVAVGEVRRLDSRGKLCRLAHWAWAQRTELQSVHLKGAGTPRTGETCPCTHSILAEILVLIRGAILQTPGVPTSTRIAARLQ